MPDKLNNPAARLIAVVEAAESRQVVEELENKMGVICEYLTKVSPDAVFATLASIAILTAGGFAKWIYELIKDASQRRELRKYFVTYLDSLVPLIEKRASAFQALVDSANGNQETFDYTEISLKSELINDLPHIELFRALVRGFPKRRESRLREYDRVVATLDLLSRQLTITKSQFQYFVDQHRGYVQTWHRSVSDILMLHRELLTFANANNIKPSSDPFLQNINRMHHEWSKLPDNGRFDVVHRGLLEPIKEICVKNQKDSRRVPFLNLVVEAQNANANRENILHLLRKYFKSQADETLTTRKRIIDGIAVLK